MNKILSKSSFLADLIEAYSDLTARLRVVVQETTDNSWQLLMAPHRVAFVDTVIRDLGRALVDPMEGCEQSDYSTPEPQLSLPSPVKRPQKKRCDLGSMLTQALAIPLATELPTPNARKTCALVIWLLLTQRLSADVLAPAEDRIAYALRRAVEGELGKEGNKGAVTDGLKVRSLA
ncbi:hypothetical protein BGW80DRAFT_1295530 [Lactifluus volemus]|nr:hypothetical protein BGW80DRAFT_1295530 [Lactifluus volemus]